MPGIAKNIGVDALPIIADLQKGAGISKFVAGLMRGVLAADRRNKYLFFARHASGASLEGLRRFLAGRAPVRRVLLPDRAQELCWRSAAMSRCLEGTVYRDIDIFVSTTYFTPRLERKKVVSFVYDLTPMKSACFGRAARSDFEALLVKTVSRSDLFLAISESTRQDFISAFKVPADKVKVVYPFASDSFRPLTEKEAAPALARHNICGQYLLYAGVRSRNKNLIALLKAFADIADGIPHNLVLAGRPDASREAEEEILSFIKGSGLARRVSVLDYVPQADLPALYSGASAFIFPSFYEGFGLPVLEALACGVPVITSNTSSLPEVVGRAGITVDPADHAALGAAVLRVLSDADFRAGLLRNGAAQLEKFAPEKSVEGFLSALESVQ